MKKFTSISLALLAALASTAALAQANIPLPASVTPQSPGSPPRLPPGLYMSVSDGSIVVSNKGGTTNFAAGQFGYTSSIITPPVMVPANPAVKFTQPVQFTKPTPTPANATTVAGRSGAVDCIVR